jgi:hypothetical protein
MLKLKFLKFIFPDGTTCTNPCTPNPCPGGGACSNTFTSPFYSCGCPNGYSGSACDIRKRKYINMIKDFLEKKGFFFLERLEKRRFLHLKRLIKLLNFK